MTNETTNTRPICSCEIEDDGGPESGPHISIVAVDPACPLHGGDAADADDAPEADDLAETASPASGPAEKFAPVSKPNPDDPWALTDLDRDVIDYEAFSAGPVSSQLDPRAFSGLFDEDVVTHEMFRQALDVASLVLGIDDVRHPDVRQNACERTGRALRALLG